MNTKIVLAIAAIAMLGIQVVPSFAVLEEFGAGLDDLAGIIQQELSTDQQSSIEINGNDNEVNVNQKQETDYELENSQPVYTQFQSEGDLTIKVKLTGDCGNTIVKVEETSSRSSGQCGETVVFKHQDIVVGQTFKVCAEDNNEEICRSGVNTEKKAPETVTINF